MNHQAKLIRYWCMRQPRPSAFTVYNGTEKQTVETGPRTSWARVAETLEAMDADRIDALSVNGNIIRSCKPVELDNDGDEDGDEDGREAGPAAPVATDAETARFQMFSSLLSQAYKDAQAQVGLRNGAVFDRMIDLFETLAQQSKDQAHALDVQQKTITKLYEEQLKQAFARAGEAGETGGGGIVEELIQAFMSGKNNAAEAGADEPEDETAAPPAAPNGKGPH